MHTGLAHVVDEPAEFHHSRCWASSIGTTSGRYAHFKDGAANDGQPIFPSEIVYYWRQDDDCWLNCQEQDDLFQVHIGRVIGVGHDYFTNAVVEDHVILFEIFECVPTETLFQASPESSQNKMDWEEGELMLDISNIEYIPEDHIGDYADVSVDYYTGETFTDPNPLVKERKKTFTKYRRRPPFPAGTKFMVKRTWLDDDDTDHEDRGLRPMAYTHPIRAELEPTTWPRSF